MKAEKMTLQKGAQSFAEAGNADTRIGQVVPQFNIVTAVRCNLCGATLYLNANNVDAENATGTLQAGVDTWKQSGDTHHRCRSRRKKHGQSYKEQDKRLKA
jgi:hypothetical protein